MNGRNQYQLFFVEEIKTTHFGVGADSISALWIQAALKPALTDRTKTNFGVSIICRPRSICKSRATLYRFWMPTTTSIDMPHNRTPTVLAPLVNIAVHFIKTPRVCWPRLNRHRLAPILASWSSMIRSITIVINPCRINILTKTKRGDRPSSTSVFPLRFTGQCQFRPRKSVTQIF